MQARTSARDADAGALKKLMGTWKGRSATGGGGSLVVLKRQ